MLGQTRSNDVYAWTAHFNVNRPYGTNGLNQLTSAGGQSISHDARGNLTGDGVNGYSYNSVNQLMTHISGGIVNNIYYEPSSGMLSSVNANVGPNGLDTRFAWSGPELLLERSGTTGAILRRYVHGAGSDDPIGWYEGSTLTDRRFLMADERGSIVSVTDSADSTIAINSYDEYGIPAPTNVGRFGYTGQIWLPELKLWYYKARIYSPTLGRFLQTDPIGYKDGINWYAYAGGDPVNRVDPDGTCAGPLIVPCGIKVAEAITATVTLACALLCPKLIPSDPPAVTPVRQDSRDLDRGPTDKERSDAGRRVVTQDKKPDGELGIDNRGEGRSATGIAEGSAAAAGVDAKPGSKGATVVTLPDGDRVVSYPNSRTTGGPSVVVQSPKGKTRVKTREDKP